MEENIQIQLVGDRPVVRAGCRYFLEKNVGINIIIESSSGHKAINDYKAYKPDIVIMDLVIPDMDAFEAIQLILTKFPNAKIIILSMTNSLTISKALLSGAKGILCKGNLPSELMTAIRAVQQGSSYIDTTLSKEIALNQLKPNTNNAPSLTKRERQLLLQLLKGNTITQIAFDLRISPKTVRVHKSNLMKKLGTRNMIELTKVGIKEGLITT